MKEFSGNKGLPEIPNVCLPIAEGIFARRAERFRSLAQSNALTDYLYAMASLADAQQAAMTAALCISSEKPSRDKLPLNATEWCRDGSWRPALRTIISKMEKVPIPAPALVALGHLSTYSPAELEASADALLAGNYAQLELASAPFIGAALQVFWTALAGSIDDPGEAPLRNDCPVCASAPVAGVVREGSKLRYLVCGLCSTEWYWPRLTCSNCGSTEGISYFGVEGDSSGAKVECCARCRTYLKLLYCRSAPAAEPFADDAATLALDTLVSEEGFSRTGPNFYLLPGTGTR